jgi:hypothetical protein
MSPFSNSRGVCYHCTLEKRGKRGWRSRGTKLSDERSTPIFQLLDDTGWCIIDPNQAHVIGGIDRTWAWAGY